MPEEQPNTQPSGATAPDRASAASAPSPSGATAPPGGSPPPKKGSKLPLVAGVAIAAAAAFFLFSPGNANLGEDHANWKHHEGLKKAQVTKLDRTGANVTKMIGVGASDLATEMESQVKTALASGDMDAARDLLTGGAVGPDGKEQPKLDEKVAEKIKSGAVRLYNVYLRDTCAEDGDIAEVLVDGKPFRRIALTNAGENVVIPLPAGKPSQITIRGVVDGGGGITLGCRTSQGEHFAQVMTPGQSIILPFGF